MLTTFMQYLISPFLNFTCYDKKKLHLIYLEQLHDKKKKKENIKEIGELGTL